MHTLHLLVSSFSFSTYDSMWLLSICEILPVKPEVFAKPVRTARKSIRQYLHSHQAKCDAVTSIPQHKKRIVMVWMGSDVRHRIFCNTKCASPAVVGCHRHVWQGSLEQIH